MGVVSRVVACFYGRVEVVGDPAGEVHTDAEQRLRSRRTVVQVHPAPLIEAAMIYVDDTRAEKTVTIGNRTFRGRWSVLISSGINASGGMVNANAELREMVDKLTRGTCVIAITSKVAAEDDRFPKTPVKTVKAGSMKYPNNSPSFLTTKGRQLPYAFVTERARCNAIELGAKPLPFGSNGWHRLLGRK